MDFFTIDVETANADMASICQIGIAHFVDGTIADEWKSFVDPEEEFDVFNIAIHGIDENTVKGSPNFPAVINRIHELLDNHISVCHTHFDRVSINQVCNKYGMIPPITTWLDSALVARRTWGQFAWKGYGVKSICDYLGYQYKCHDALEDAKATGYILTCAIKQTGLDIDNWLKRIREPIDITHSSEGPYIQREGNPEGFLYGEIMVFTGALTIHRSEAADMAAKIGCKVEDGVNRQTTLLVVGDQDIKKLVGHEKSTKHRRAEELIAAGQPIRILRETDFKALVGNI